jgi:hypothetical protein
MVLTFKNTRWIADRQLVVNVRAIYIQGILAWSAYLLGSVHLVLLFVATATITTYTRPLASLTRYSLPHSPFPFPQFLHP